MGVAPGGQRRCGAHGGAGNAVGLSCVGRWVGKGALALTRAEGWHGTARGAVGMDTGVAMRPARWDLLVVAVLLVSAVVIWLPALWTPFWGDDYVLLQAARAANLAGKPW